MEPIKPMQHHYSFENPASIYDEEALTALELAGRTAKKVSEIVNHTNTFTENITQQQENFEKDLTKRQDDFEKEIDGRVDTCEEAIGDFADKLTEFEEVTIPQVVQEETAEQIANGALDHVVVENIEILGTQLENLVQMEGNVGNVSAEVVDARVGNGGVTYPTLGEAVRQQTTNIKPERLNPTGAEWKSDTQVSGTRNSLILGLGGFGLGMTQPEGIRDSWYYPVESGREYLYTVGMEIPENYMTGGWFIFTNTLGSVCIGNTNIPDFVTLVDESNWVYRIRVPLGVVNLVTWRPVDRTPELWLVNTTAKMEWLRADGDNIEAGTIGPLHMVSSGGTWYRDVPYTRTMHCYKRMNGSNTIEDHAMTGMCLCTVEGVKPGQVYRVPIGSDISSVLNSYFVFAAEDGQAACPDPSLYVECVNAEEYIYHATIPLWCTTFYTACDSAHQLNIQEVVEKVELPWLKVTEENLDGVDLNPPVQEPDVITNIIKSRPCMDYIGRLPEMAGIWLAIGDSISAGIYSNVDGTTSESAAYSPLSNFCCDEMLCPDGHNASQSGSTMVDWYSTISNGEAVTPRIADLINEWNPVSTFIALGTNDFLTGVNLDTFKVAVKGIMDYIQGINDARYSADKNETTPIFILPPPVATEVNELGLTLDDYRKVIFDQVIDHDYTCVDGGSFPLDIPGNGFALDYVRDGIHPTRVGQKIYTKSLAKKLLPWR